MTRVVLHEVRKAYHVGTEVMEALDGISLEIRPGQLVAVLGGRGSGKSTLLKILAGRVQPDGGAVLTDGAPPVVADEPTHMGEINRLRALSREQGQTVIISTRDEQLADQLAALADRVIRLQDGHIVGDHTNPRA